MTTAQTTKLFKYALIIVASLATLAAFLWLTAETTPEVSATSHCRTTSVSSADISTSVAASGRSGGGSVSDSDTSSVTFSSYTNSGEYVDQVSFDTDVSYTYCAADTDCYATAGAYGTLSDSSDSDSIYIYGTGYPDGDSDGGTLTLNNDPNGASGVNFSTEVSAEAYGGLHGISSYSSVSNVELTICDEPSDPPEATDDGQPDNRICAQDGVDTDIYVLENDDANGGTLTITGLTSYPSRGTATITTDSNGNELIRYSPSSLGEDSFTYQVSDGQGGTDTANVYTENKDGCGSVTADFSGISDPSQATIEPSYDENDDGNFDDSSEKLSKLEGDKAANSGWNVTLYKNSRKFAIDRDDIETPDGYEVDPTFDWISKDVPMKDFTSQENTAELGLSYSEPDVWTCEVDGVDEKTRDFDLYDSDGNHMTARMAVMTNEDPDNLYSTIYTKYVQPPEDDITSVEAYGDSGATESRHIEDYGYLNADDANSLSFNNPDSTNSGDLATTMSISPESRGDVSRAYFPSPPDSDPDGHWEFSYSFRAEMTDQSPANTPPQTVNWDINIVCDKS